VLGIPFPLLSEDVLFSVLSRALSFCLRPGLHGEQESCRNSSLFLAFTVPFVSSCSVEHRLSEPLHPSRAPPAKDPEEVLRGAAYLRHALMPRECVSFFLQ